MRIESRVGYAENAFFGEKIRNADFVKKVDGVAEEVNKILNPIDDIAKRKVLEDSIRLIRGLGIQVDQVSSLNETLRDPNKSEVQRENAEGVLDVLAKGTYIAMRYGENKEIVADLCSGSVEKIEARLPEPLKGLGERIRENIIDEEQIKGILDALDKKRARFEKAGEAGKGKLQEAIVESIGKLGDLDVDSTKEDQLGMVMAFLGVEAEELGGERGERQLGKTEGVVIGSSPYEDMEGSDLGEQEGSLGRVRKTIELSPNDVEDLHSIESIEQMKGWLVEQLLKVVESPTGFASWWQADYAGQLLNMASGQLGLDRMSKEFLDLKDFAYASISVLGLQAVDRNADDNSANYQNFTPPKAMAALLHWDDGGEKMKIIKKNPIVRRVFREVFNNAFENGEYDGQGWKVVEAFSSKTDGRSQDSYVLNVLKKLLSDESFVNECKSAGISFDDLGKLVPLGRVAMAWFEVDSLPEMVRWAHANKKAEKNGDKTAKKLDWFQGYTKDQGTVKENIWDSKLTYSVKVNGEVLEGKLPYNHPRLVRPWDLLQIKGSFLHNPGLLKQMEETIEPFISRQLLDDNGRVKAANTENIIDKYAKYNKVLDFITGGPQGFDMDNHEKMTDLLKAAGNYWGGDPGKDEGFRTFIAEIFALKVASIFFPGYNSRMNNVLSGLNRLDTMSTEADRKTALRSVIGDIMNDSHGFVGECQRMYGFDLTKMPQFNDAFIMLLMDQPDLKKAYKGHRRGQLQLLFQVISNGAASIGEVLKSFK